MSIDSTKEFSSEEMLEDILDDMEHQSAFLEDEDENIPMKKPENRDCFRSSRTRVLIIVVFVLLLPAACIAYGTQLLLKDTEEAHLDWMMDQQSRQIVGVVESRLANQVHALNVLAGAMSHGNNDGKITTSFHDLLPLMNDLQELVPSSKVIFQVPIIDASQVSDWETYANDISGEVGGPTSIHSFLEGDQTSHDGSRNLSHNKKKHSFHLPIWQVSQPDFDPKYYNSDLAFVPEMKEALSNMSFILTTTNFIRVNESSSRLIQELTHDHKSLEPSQVLLRRMNNISVSSQLSVPVALGMVYSWKSLFADLLVKEECPMNCVVENSCEDTGFRYLIQGNESRFLGETKLSFPPNRLVSVDIQVNNATNVCRHTIHIYPEASFEEIYSSEASEYAIMLIGVVFLFIGLSFCIYDYILQSQYQSLKQKEIQSNAIVSEMFPGRIRERLYQEQSDHVGSSHQDMRFHSEESETSSPRTRKPKIRLKNILRGQQNEELSALEEPIAEYFPHCTVLFADIVGFTAWSSQRDPAQVFQLLQAIYRSFDIIAKKLRVFKVETIGDTYLAVTGIPEAQENHALIMSIFACKCKVKMQEVVQDLERTLGPDTSDLDMRFGLHSGPVTAGVLRGERSRFQLFGDTVNTAARMESTGMRGRIQLSESTAMLLKAKGKSHWIKEREELVDAKGKGQLRSFWLEPRGARSVLSIDTDKIRSVKEDSEASVSDHSIDMIQDESPEEVPCREMKSRRQSIMWGASQEVLGMEPPTLRRNRSVTGRLVEWNVDTLLSLLKKIASCRRTKYVGCAESDLPGNQIRLPTDTNNLTAIDEVKEIIELSGSKNDNISDLVQEDFSLDYKVVDQLRRYVAMIASMYRDNPFHNYEHACHVQMSMIKLLQQIVDETNEEKDENDQDRPRNPSCSYFTSSITSDPLTQFGVIFAALIHDVDHTGVTNGQLVKEQAHVAVVYKNKSVAEQNSIDLAWELLMSKDFGDLRQAIFNNEEELNRFRQIVVNVVLATDIFDQELSALRKNRWERAFSSNHIESTLDARNRKATIVLEHLIQASDVSHTMQHFDIYRKWNERLFFENQMAFNSGRMSSDPAKGWYQGELWFFDNYVIPLAKKLKECGVFGVCSDECLEYALENRRLWELQGEDIVKEMNSKDYLQEQKRLRKAYRGMGP